MTFQGGKVKLETRRRALLRSAKTRASNKFTAGGSERRYKDKPKPITLAKVSPDTHQN